MEQMVGILAYVYRNQVEADLQHNLNETFVQQYGFGIEQTFAIDKMQQEVIHTHLIFELQTFLNKIDL